MPAMNIKSKSQVMMKDFPLLSLSGEFHQNDLFVVLRDWINRIRRFTLS